MTKKKLTELQPGDYFDCGKLDDGSHVCVRLGGSFRKQGNYEIVKDVPGGTPATDPVLDEGYLTLEAAKILAWQYIQNSKGEKVTAK